MLSLPPQVELNLGHNGNNDMCEAWLHQELSYDISLLRQNYQSSHGQSGTIVVHVGDETVDYNF